MTIRASLALLVLASACPGPRPPAPAEPAAKPVELPHFEEPGFVGMEPRHVSYDFDRTFAATGSPPPSGAPLDDVPHERRRRVDLYLQEVAELMRGCTMPRPQRIRVRFYADRSGTVRTARVVAEPGQPPGSAAAADCVFGILRGVAMPQQQMPEGGFVVPVPGPVEIEVTFLAP